MKMKLSTVTIFMCGVFAVGATVKIFNKIINRQPPTAIVPYKNVTVIDEQQCYGMCNNDYLCLSVGFGDLIGGSSSRYCALYNNNSHSLVMNSGGSVTFYIAAALQDCMAWLRSGANDTGVYPITIEGRIIRVRCNMDEDGGGWIVFQRRLNMVINFQRSFAEYKEGFGSLHGEHWLGNEILHQITRVRGEHDFFVRATDYSDVEGSMFSKHSGFTVASEADKYLLRVGALAGGAASMTHHDNCTFTTIDQWNGGKVDYNCALEAPGRGGWWFHLYCASFQPNTKKTWPITTTSTFDGPIWRGWFDNDYDQMKNVELMIRRI